MDSFKEYIIEKLCINKDINIDNKKSKYNEIYNIDCEDIVLVEFGYRFRGDIYVQLYPAIIEDIDDDQLKVYNIKTNKPDKDVFTFVDPNKLPPVSKSFAFIHNKEKKYWKALIHKDTAITMINDTLNRYKKGNIIWFSTYKLDGKNKRKTLENLLKELNDKN